jgi:hypothetical protein
LVDRKNRTRNKNRSSGTVSLAWLAAAIGLAFTLWAFYPGYVTQDSAEQYHQARTGDFDTHHPPLMAMLWRITDRVIPGPGGLFALFAIAYWAALAFVAAYSMRGRWWQVVAVAIIGFWPPMIGLIAHVWKDVGLLTMFMLATGLLVRESWRPSRLLLIVALGLIALGAGFRHNGLFAALPFMPYLAARWVQAKEQGTATRTRIITIAVLAFLATTLIAQLPNYFPNVKRRSMWPTVALWDLAAVSIDQGRILIPDSLVRSPLTLPELQSTFDDSTNTSTFSTGKIVLSLFAPYSAKQDRDLLHAWLALPFQHAAAYWRHRWRLTRRLFGSGDEGRPAGLVLQPEYQTMAGNPAITPNHSRLNNFVMASLFYVIGTPLFGGWFYLSIALVVLVSCIRRSGRAHHQLTVTIAISGLCYALPLIVISGAADFRYLSWLVGASLIAALLRFGSPRAVGTTETPRTQS